MQEIRNNERERTRKGKDKWTTGNKISVEGAKALSTMLQANTTLTSLNLRSKKEEEKRKNNKEMIFKKQIIRLELKEQHWWVKCFKWTPHWHH